MRPARRAFVPLLRAALPGAAVILAAILAHEAGAAEPAPRVAARRVAAGDVRVDGDLSDAAWAGAAWFDAFRQSVPDFGRPATETTAVAFLFDERTVYVAVRCDDSEPALIRASKLRHRDEPDTDDHVQVIFDTYRDLVRGAVFVVNPNGAKEEGLVSGYQRYTWSWDEVWEAKAAVTPRGWQVEIAVPLRLLRYAGARQQEWGVNVTRVIRRTQEEVYLAAPPPPFDISSLNYAGTLAGLELGERARNLQLIPYALAGTVQETVSDGSGRETRTIRELGADLKYSLTSDLTLDATYNTDFAQVESDDEQVNLTRFSLFYPEKREFFLENASLFSFGSSSGPGGTSLTPFFSRRIGLHQGRTVPIEGGVRLTGKVGRQDVGVLSVRTDGVDSLGLDPAWYTVARVRRDLGGRSYVGGIVTDSRRNGAGSTTLGADGEWYFTDSLLLRGFCLAVDGDDGDPDGDAVSYSTALDLTTDPWGFLFGYTLVEEGFAPDLGYVQRDGFRRIDASLRRSIRPDRWGIRRVSFRTFNNWYDSLVHDTRESSRLNLTCQVELESGDELDIAVNRNYERLFEPFELDDALVFAAGEYTYTSAELQYRSEESRRWGVEAEASLGEFYDGDRTHVEAGVWWVLSRHLRAAASYALYDIAADHGALDWTLWSARVEYIFSAAVSASAYLQHNSSSGADVYNVRLRWILPNDSDLFIVLNERRADAAAATPAPAGRDAAVKVSYRFFL
jgi:hypothetical protein